MARVSMIVWNTFQNDARVLKEAETLAGQGHRRHRLRAAAARRDPGARGARPRPRGGAGEPHPAAGAPPPLRARRQPPARPVAAGVTGAFVDTPLKSSRLRRAGEILSRSAIHLGLYRAMVASRPDVVHAHDVNTLPTAWAAARRAGARLVYDAHEISTDREGYRELRGLIAWAEKRLMPRADATITTTEMRAKFFARAYGVPRPLVLQNRPRFAEPRAAARCIRDRLGLDDGLPVVLYQGGLQPGRGLEDLVAAMPALPPCHLVYIGGGRLLARAQGHGRRARPRGPRPLRPHRAARRAPRLDRLGRHRRAADPQHLPQPPQHRFEQALRVRHGRAAGGGERLPRDPPGGQAHDIGLLFDPETPGALAAALGRLVADGACGRGSPPTPARAPGRSAGRRRRRELVGLYERVLARSSVLSPAAEAGAA